MKIFTEMNLIDALQKAVSQEGYVNPTPIQEQAIPHLLDGIEKLNDRTIAFKRYFKRNFFVFFRLLIPSDICLMFLPNFIV